MRTILFLSSNYLFNKKNSLLIYLFIIRAVYLFEHLFTKTLVCKTMKSEISVILNPSCSSIYLFLALLPVRLSI